MTSVLAIETSTPACSVALRMGDTVISRYCEEPRSHTKLVMSMVDKVLGQASIKAADLHGLAVTLGPGSFTGLRIGFATVQGLAFGLDLPVVAVSTLQVMAQTAVRKQGLEVGEIIMPILDARMGEFNCGCYRLESNGDCRALMQDQLLTAEKALQLINQYQPHAVVGEGGQLEMPHLIDLYPDALDLVDIADAKFAQGLAQPIDSIELIYLRGTDSWQKRKRIRAS
ncbi:MAG: tRNA (adenosine(37)-N6)-threonylcarbamoyltransferase complex dimerization subunit type 1 TsaB [Porticoccaceae bacterium]|nr:tRNA (adenosine(37)-N6)-threonylcarbamoyltransferase complex dimerization subunit type 1 TsaB [Porticoccaceae bacterium]